jgi:hypothetical protein
MRCVEKAEKIAEAAGFTPKAVPPKILFPLPEGASMEHDEVLNDMWVALLANDSWDSRSMMRPGFISLLKEMAPDEARRLDGIPKLWNLYHKAFRPSNPQTHLSPPLSCMVDEFRISYLLPLAG